MPTAPKAKAPKYCLHKPSGRAYIRIRGRVRYIGEHGTPESLDQYGRLIRELASQPDVPPPSLAGGLTVVELANAYWQFCQAYYRKKDGSPGGWLVHIQLILNKHLAPLYGETAAEDFGPKAFKTVRQRLVDLKHSRPYVNKLMPIVTRCFKWGAGEELVPGSVYQNLRCVEGLRKGRTTAREPAPVLPVDQALVDATLPYLPPIVADMVRFQRLTGCRPGEVCQLRPIDLDRSGEVWRYRPESHKTEHHGRERVIFIGPKAQAIILPYLLRDAQAHCFSPAESVEAMREARRSARKTPIDRGNRTGTNRKADPKRTARESYTKDSYARAIRRGIDKANMAILEDAKEFQIEKPVLLAYWAPNRLRHACATEVRRTHGLEAAQVILGHAKADITQVYAERDGALAVEVMKKIG